MLESASTLSESSRVCAPSRFPQACHQCVGQAECLLGGLSPETQRRLEGAVRERGFKRHETLSSQGRQAEVLRVIKVGLVVLSQRGQDALPRPIAVLGRGATLGKHGLLGEADPFEAVAMSAGRVCEIAAATATALRAQDPRFDELLLRSHLQGLGQMVEWAHIARMPAVFDRVISTLLLFGQLQQSLHVQLPRLSEFAGLIGSTRETVTRLLKRLELGQRVRRIDSRHVDISALVAHHRPVAEM